MQNIIYILGTFANFYPFPGSVNCKQLNNNQIFKKKEHQKT